MKSSNLNRPVGQGPQNLQQKEAKETKQQRSKGLTSSDAARLASQAGFQRADKKRGKGIHLGDSSNAPIPLPDDDLDAEVWSQERLEGAQGSLSLAGAQFAEVSKAGPGAADLGQAIVGSSYMPVEEDLAELEDLAERKPPKPVPMMEEVSNSVVGLFGIDLKDVPVGHKAIATALVVAGSKESVQVADGMLDEATLADGLQKVTKEGNQAVGEAQKMNKGINVNVNVQRTFFRR